MSNPSAQRDNDMARVVCSIIAELTNKLEKGKEPGSATLSGANGEKDLVSEDMVKNVQESLMNIKVEDHNVGYEKETGIAVRNVNGKNQLVDKDYMKKIYKDAKRSGKNMTVVKAPNVKDVSSENSKGINR